MQAITVTYTLANKKQSVNNIKQYNYDRIRAFGFSVKKN